nr:myoneurin-like [Cherax quadricarinatus]
MSEKFPPKEEREYPCPTCGKVFTHPSSLIYHRDSTHNNGRMFVCHLCGSAFKHKQLLQRHYSVHSEDRPFPCEVCCAAFKTRGNLYNHMNTHTGLKKFTCEICGKQFNHLTSLTLHVRSHTGEKPFKCDYCGKRFTQNGNLQEHKRIHTGEKPYCCTTCRKKFTTSSQFKLHMRRHSGEKSFFCSYCNKSCLNREAWQTHEKKHTGDKPYVCEVCNKGFTEQYTMRKHLRMHTTEKPYVCNMCEKSFSGPASLLKHRKCHCEAETWLLSDPSTIDQLEGDHRIIYILSEKDEGDATIAALQAVKTEVAEESQLENITDGTTQMIQLNPDSPTLQGFTLSPYNHKSTATTVMLQQGANQETDTRQIQICTNEDGQSVIPVINSSGETIAEVQGHFLSGVSFKVNVKSYLEEKNLPLKALLIMDNAPARHPSLQDYVLPEFDFTTVKFLPPNTTPLIQPMDQEVIGNFKKLYTKSLFQRCFEVTSDTELTLRVLKRSLYYHPLTKPGRKFHTEQ